METRWVSCRALGSALLFAMAVVTTVGCGAKRSDGVLPTGVRPTEATAAAQAQARRERNAATASETIALLKAFNDSSEPEHRRRPLSLSDYWEQYPFYSPPPRDACVQTSAKPPQSGQAGFVCYMPDSVAQLALPPISGQPDNGNTFWDQSYITCTQRNWAVTGTLDGSLILTVSPTKTGHDGDRCSTVDTVTTFVRRTGTPYQYYTGYSTDGSFSFYTGVNYYSSSEQNLFVNVLNRPPPAPCVAFSREIYAAAQQYGLRKTWLAAIAAHESGTPPSDDARNINEIGGGGGQGIFQITDASDCPNGVNPGTGDVAGNAMCGATKMHNAMTRCGNERDAEAYYNTGRCKGRTVAYRTWGSESIPYQDSVARLETRINDFKSVCNA